MEVKEIRHSLTLLIPMAAPTPLALPTNLSLSLSQTQTLLALKGEDAGKQQTNYNNTNSRLEQIGAVLLPYINKKIRRRTASSKTKEPNNKKLLHSCPCSAPQNQLPGL